MSGFFYEESGAEGSVCKFGVGMSIVIRRLSFDEVVDHLLSLKETYHKNYLAMYSSWYGGIITDPALMMVPIDDHLVHRGDGVFEAFKSVGLSVYGLERHLDRIERSAQGSSLALPMTRSQLVEAILETLRAANSPDCLVKLIVSRGPGGFSANPYECPAGQVYIVAAALSPPPEAKYRAGVSLKTSRIPMKKDYFANIKSCNYLPNVLMKKEAVDAGVDFTVSVDDGGYLGEGATENIGFVTEKREFLVPRFQRILRGVTVSRMMELAESLLATGELSAVREADITPAVAYDAPEIMMFGTSFDVLAVVDYDGHAIGDGHPGLFYGKFLELLRRDMRTNPEMRTPVKGPANG